MFGALTEKLHHACQSLSGNSKISESNISDAIREIRLALLDADVNYQVAKKFILRVKEKALGDTVLKSIKAGQQFTKIVHDELCTLMGGNEELLKVPSPMGVILLCGLQGAGKTTHSAKLANYLKGKEYGKKPMLVACDRQRPAAIEQLQTLGRQIDVPVFNIDGEKNPLKVVKAALKEANNSDCDVLIVDTAGRLHIDDVLMKELKELKSFLKPHEVLFVANAAMGQDAVKTAAEFERQIGMTGTILTMLDSDTRGGAAISIADVTGKPLKFEGMGEKLADLQAFHPQSMADRILGMGDAINLVRKAQEHFDESETEELERKLKKASFTYEDYLKHMRTMKKMGPLKGLLKMVPGLGNALGDFEIPEKELAKVEAIILSMTLRERQEKDSLSNMRRRRIAKGSGVELAEVNRLNKGFKQTKKMFKNMPNKNQLAKMMGGLPQ